jgi:hypothetical protein
MFAAVALCSLPAYREMSDQNLSLFELIAKFNNYFVVLEKDLPEVYAILGLPKIVSMRGMREPLRILTRQKVKPFIMRPPINSAQLLPIFPSTRLITGQERLEVNVISQKQALRFNELFLSRRIDYAVGGGGLFLVFTLDGLVIGKADFTKTVSKWKLPEPGGMVYLMSDLAIPHDHPRLAKLMLMALLSRETQEMLKVKFLDDFRYVVTSVFSLNPASMKYRGIFKLHDRDQLEDGSYKLNYFAFFSGKNLIQTLQEWKKKYHK